MTIELTDRERELLTVLVDQERDALGRRVRNKQEQLKLPDVEGKPTIKNMLKIEMTLWNELRALSEKLNK